MKQLFKSVKFVVAMTLVLGTASCSDSDDEPGSGNPPVDKNAIVESISVDGMKYYVFEYDGNNKVKVFSIVRGMGKGRYVFNQEDGAISVTKDGDEASGYGFYGYENGYITTTPWGNTMIYEDGKLIKGDFCAITWDGDNISKLVRSGKEYVYVYSALKNNTSVNLNAIVNSDMKVMIDDEDGDYFVMFGLAAGTKNANLLSEVHYDLYDEDNGYIGSMVKTYAYETDSQNRVVKITVTDDHREYGGSLSESVYEITYKK